MTLPQDGFMKMTHHWLRENAVMICDTLDSKADWSIDECRETVWCEQIIIKRDSDNLRVLIREHKGRVTAHILAPKCEAFGLYSINDCLPDGGAENKRKWEVGFGATQAAANPEKFARQLKSRLFDGASHVWPYVTSFVRRHESAEYKREALKDRLCEAGYKRSTYSKDKLYADGLPDVDICSGDSIRIASPLYVTEAQLLVINAILKA